MGIFQIAFARANKFTFRNSFKEVAEKKIRFLQEIKESGENKTKRRRNEANVGADKFCFYKKVIEILKTKRKIQIATVKGDTKLCWAKTRIKFLDSQFRFKSIQEMFEQILKFAFENAELV